MNFKLELTLINPQDGSEIREEIALLEKSVDQLEDIGLSLSESKTILENIQTHMIQNQTKAYAKKHRYCEDCAKACRKKGKYSLVYQTLFGDIQIPSPRYYTCPCKNDSPKTFSPLSRLFQSHVSPERMYLETKWASLIPFEKTVNLLKDVLPVSEKLNRTSVRNHLIKVSQREESELAEEQFMFADGCQRDWDELPIPEGRIVVGLDGGYLRSWDERKTNFEVIAGKSLPRDQDQKYFAFVDTYNEAKPKRRLFETLKAQGLQMNQNIEFFSDGAANLHELQKFLSPISEHYLDWFHITMRITVLNQYLKGMVKIEQEEGEALQEKLKKIKWYLWHGNVHKALDFLESFEDDSFCLENDYENLEGFKQHVEDFCTYIRNNQGAITNYGERQRNGEVFTTSFTESAVNEVIARRFCKKQQMQWTKKGAHYLLQTRTKVLNGDLADCFRKWYPNFMIQEKIPDAA